MSQVGRPAGGRVVLFGCLALLVASGGVGLGAWQLSRAGEKSALLHSQEARARLPMLDGRTLATTSLAAPGHPEAMVSAPPLLHRRIELRGQWLADHTVYLDNRQMQDRAGFYVVTPLRLAGLSMGSPASVVLVQRGWIPRNFEDRARLEPVQTPAGEVVVPGVVEPALSRTFALSGHQPGEGSSPIRQNQELASYRQETGLPLSALVVIQTGSLSEGLQRQWPAADLGLQRHYGYAFQWFALAVLALFLYVRLNLLPFVRRSRQLSPAA